MNEENKIVEDDEIDILELFAVLVNARIKIIVITLLAILLSVVVALVMTPVYNSSTKIVYQSTKQSMGQFSSLAALAGVNMGGGTDPSAYLNDIIKSNEFLDSILSKKWKTDDGKLLTLAEFWKVEIDSTQPLWREKLDYSLKESLKKGHILYSQDKKTSVITIGCEFQDPNIAYNVNKYVVSLLNEFILTKMHFKASENKKFVEKRLKKSKYDLRQSEDNLRLFREKNIIASSPKLKMDQQRLLRDLEIASTVYIQLQKQYELAKIEEKKNIPVLDIIDYPVKPVLKVKPKRKIIVIMGAILGFFISVFFVFALEWWKNNKKKIKGVIK